MFQHPRRRMFAALTTAAILACGVTGLWFFAFMWIQGIASGFMPSDSNEWLVVTTDGRALIARTQPSGGTSYVSYRTLDGTLDGEDASTSDIKQLSAIHLTAAPLRPNVLGWSQRLGRGTADMQSMPTYWFFIRSEKTPGRAYFQLFDSVGKQSIGYFATRGFTFNLPSDAEQFAAVPREGYATIDRYDGGNGSSALVRAAAAYVIADHALWRIDLDKRVLRSIPTPDEPITLAQWAQRNQDPEADVRSGMGVRTMSQIVLLDLAGDVQKSIPIPAALRDRDVQLYLPIDAPPIIASHSDDRSQTDLYWTATDDRAERHEVVRLGQPLPNDDRAAAWVAVAAAPSSVFQAIVMANDVQSEVEHGTHSRIAAEELAHDLSNAWPALLALACVSAVLALLCYRHDRRYAERGAAVWALFVFVAGMPGAIGYWLHRRWPPRAPCAACDMVVPRDRDECFSCAAEFPAPQPLGIEILA